jgi:DNA repair exonuclease SbcCD ATPase subunit
MNYIFNILKKFKEILEKKFLIRKKQFFKHLVNNKLNKKEIMSNLILNKLRFNLTKLYRIYKKYENRTFIQFFLGWKFLLTNDKVLSNFQKEIEINTKKQIENKKQILNKNILDIEKSNKEIKITLESEKEKNNNFNKKIKSYIDKEAIFENKIKSIEHELKILKDKIKQAETEIKNIQDKNQSSERYIKELELNIKNLNEQLNEKEQDLKIYIQDMNEMLDYFEKTGYNLFKLADALSLGRQSNEISKKEHSQGPNNLKSTFKITSLPSNLIVKGTTSKTTISNKTFRSSLNNSSRNSLSNSVRTYIKQ